MDPNGMNGEFWVECIRGHTYIEGDLHYLVVWSGTATQDSWQPLRNLPNCGEALADYHGTVGHTPAPTSSSGRCSGCGKFMAVSN